MFHVWERERLDGTHHVKKKIVGTDPFVHPLVLSLIYTLLLGKYYVHFSQLPVALFLEVVLLFRAETQLDLGSKKCRLEMVHM